MVSTTAGIRRVATVFGGAGFIGRYVVARLTRMDYVVRVPTRDPAGARFLTTQGKPGQVVPLVVDLGSDEAVARAVEEATAVVNCIGILAERREGDFSRLQAQVPGRIARMATTHRVERLVHLSAIGATRDSESVYARTKAEGEAALREGFPAATVLRPSIVFGPEDRFFNRFAEMARLLPVVPVIGGGTRFQPVYVGDVADAVVAAIARDDAAGKTYELAGPRAETFRGLLEYMLEVVGRRKKVVEVPPGIARFQARLLQRLPDPPLTEDQLLLLSRDNVASGELPGLADLGITPRPMETVVPGYLRRFRVGGGRRDAA